MIKVYLSKCEIVIFIPREKNIAFSLADSLAGGIKSPREETHFPPEVPSLESFIYFSDETDESAIHPLYLSLRQVHEPKLFLLFSPCLYLVASFAKF